MKVQEFLDMLTFGELKTHAIGGYTDKVKGIKDTHWPEIRNHINLGLVELYKRFPVKDKELILVTRPELSSYVLHNKYAWTVSPHDYYIEDSFIEPFTNDIINILHVVSEIYGDFSINDGSVEKSVYLPSYNQIQIPDQFIGDRFSLIYRAAPQLHGDIQPEHELEIPVHMVEPLAAYVEYRVNKSFGTDVGLQLAQAAKSQFELLCMEITQHNLMNDCSAPDNVRFNKNGWI